MNRLLTRSAFALARLWHRYQLQLFRFAPPGWDGPHLRFQLSVSMLLLGVLIVILNLIHVVFLKNQPELIVANLAFLMMGVGALAFIRWKGLYEEAIAGMILCSLTGNAIIYFLFGRSVLAPLFFFHIIYIFVAFLNCRLRLALAVSTVVLLTTLGSFYFGQTQGLIMPFGFTIDQYIARLLIVLFMVSLLGIACTAIDTSYKELNENDLRQEKDWLLKSSKLHEVSALAHNLNFQVRLPIRALRRSLSHLQGESDPKKEGEALAEIQDAVDRMILISRSFDWIYRSHQFSADARIALGVLSEHLRILLEARSLENGWQIRLFEGDEGKNVQGPIPLLVLLLVTLAQRTLDLFHARDGMSLTLSTETLQDGSLLWRMRWPDSEEKPQKAGKTEELNQTVELLRESLVEELLQASEASLEEGRDGEGSYLILKGQWVLLQAP